MTDFDKAAEQVAGAGSDPFDVAAGGVIDDGRKALRSSLYTSLMANPDMAARSQKLGRKVGLPADVVERNLPEVERNAQLNEFDKLLDRSPVVATWLADQNNAKVAHDDVESLVNIERTLRGTLRDIGVTTAKAAVGLPNAFVGLLDIPTGGKVGKALDSIGVRFNESGQILDSMYSPAQQAANREVRQAEGFVDTLGAAVKNPSVIATTVGESIPQMIGGAGIARGLMAYLPKLSPLVAGAIGEGTLGAGSAAEQIRSQNADGELTAKQSAAAVGSGVGTGLFGFIGGKLAQRFGVGDIDTALARGDLDGATLEATQKGFVRKMAEGGLSEGVFEELPQSAQEQMWQNFATDRPIMEGVGNASALGLLSGSAMGGPFAGIQHVAERRAQAAQAAEQSSAQLEELSKFATASKLRERDPDTFEQFVAQATADGPVQDVFIDANTLLQSGVADQVAILSPSVAAQLEEAAATGGNIRIPVAEYAARIAASDYGAGLLEHLKTDPQGMSRFEAQEYHQSEIQELEQQVEQAIAGQQNVDEFKASQGRVKDAILGELNQLGRFTSQKNEVDATIAAARMSVRAAQLGKTPEQFFREEALRFTAEKVVDDSQQFDQPQAEQTDTPEFREWFGESVVVDDEGKPLLVYHGTRSDFDTFDMQDPRGAAGNPKGAYFTADRSVAEQYAENSEGVLDEKSRVVAAYIRIQNDQDGMVIDNEYTGREYVVFDPTAIKSATGNRGTFNPNDPNILNQPARSSFPVERTVSFNEFQTGVPVTFDFIHNTESATKIFGKPKRNSPHGRYIEPSGRYVSQGTLPEGGQKNLIGGTLTFNNPLVLNVETWKQDLFAHYKKRGKELSKALIADGYDGVVTVSIDERPGRSHTSEILDLTTFDESKAFYQNGPKPQAATNLPKPPDEVQVLDDLPDEVADDVVTLFKDLGSDDDAFRLPRGASDDLVETIMADLPAGSHAETDFAALEAFQDEAVKRGDPDILDVKRFDFKARVKDKPGVMQEKSAFVFTNAAREVWVDLSGLDEGSSQGAAIYTRVRDWADKVGATFVGDPEGLSDAALLKRTEHMASGIARSKSTRSVKPHVRQMDPYNDPLYKNSPLNKHIASLPWLADAKINERNLVKASWRNIATVMPELKHATIDLRNGQILLENAPITTSFKGFVSGLRQANVTLRGGSDGNGAGGQVQQEPALRDARELYGSASIKRFLLANTAAQYSGQGERGLVLARLGELYPVLESLDDQKLFYQSNGEKAQDGESDLIVTHNLTADNLLHARKMGGIPVPSLAVTKKDTPLNGFGEITLIAPKDMADPKGYAGAKVFGADIYSPRYPSVEYIIPSKTIVKISREMTPAENATGERLDFDEIRRGGVRAFENSAPMMWRFLSDRGHSPEIVRNGVAELSAPLLPFANDTRHTHELREDPAFIEAAWQAHRELLVRLYDGDESAADEEIAGKRAEDNAWRTVSGYARDIERYQRELREAGKPDSYKTKRAMEQQIQELGLQDEFKASNREFLESMAPEEKIFQGFTYSGNRKYTAHTLDNVVKILKKELRGGENFNYGVGSLRAKFTPQFKSLAQIRKEKGRLMDSATFEKVKDEIDNEFFRVANLIEQDIRPDTAISIMEDAAKVGVKRAAKTYGYDLSDDAAVEIAGFLTQLRNLPTEYFEVKILREVDLAEFAGAVVPEGVDPKVIEALHARGVKDIRTYRKGDEADRAARIGEFEHLFFQRKNGPRGGYNPALNTIALFKGADLSTFLHELGHYFLESDIKIVSDLVNKPELTAGEQQIVKDVTTLFNWFGITGPVEEQLATWYSLDFEEKRAYHEKAAESFERYLFEGKAPSIELQSYFQTVRAWMTDVYQSIKNFLARNPDAGALTDEVRGVFDRMLATDEQIKLAEHGRSMMPLFASPDQAGMTPDEFAAYQALGAEATGEAVQDVQARGLRDMQWLHNARGREIRKLKKLSKSRRAEVRMEVSGEVMSQPVYRAWSFLTRKMTAEDKPVIEKPPKSGPGPLDPTVDSLFVAIAKYGGLKKDEVVSTWGIDPADKPQSGIFGKPVWRREGGLTIDEMAEALQPDNYLPLDSSGKWDVTDLEELFKSELRGNPQYSTDYAYWGYQEPRPGEGVTEDNVGAGRLDLAELKSLDIPEDAVNRVIGLRMTAKDGIHPDIVAEMFGFTSGDELVRALAYAMPPKQEIEGLTDARLLQNYGELASPEAIERAADKAIHNDARARFVATEVNALAKATGQRKILASAAREFASTMIARLKVRDVRPGQYASAEVRAAKAAVKAMQEGNLVQAAAEKRNQLINNYATRAAYDAQDDVEKGVRYLKKFENESTRKNLDADYTDQIDALLERFDLRKQSLKAIDKRKRLADWITSQREQGLEPEIPEQLEDEAFRKSYKEMTVEEFRGVVDTVKQIEHLGRLKNKLLTAADNRAFDEVKTRIAESIEEHSRGRTADTRTPTTNLGRAAQGLRRFWAAHIKAATWARIMDGGNDGGPMWEYFIRAANERGDRETTMRAEATVELSRIMAPVFKLGRMGGKGQFFPSIGRSLNREARIAIALNTGNQGNLQRLLGGEGWNLPQIMPVLQSLSAQEWEAVQAVWDHFESYRPQIAAKERRVYGREPDWIEAKPFSITTADRQEITLRGGYYPIKYDPAASQRAEEHADAEGAKRQLQGAYTSATTRRSFTKTRVEEVQGRPLLYTLAGLYSGVNDVIHDLNWHEWLIDTNRLLRSKTIDNAIRSHYGPEAKAQLKSWAADIAEGDKMADNAGEVALGRLRQGISAAGLGFNAMSAAMQVLGFTQSIARVGPTWVGRGIQQYLANPRAAARRVTEMSDFMANRSRTRFRELNELRNKVQDETEVGAAIKGGTFFLMMRAQQVVDVPTWLGAYEKAIAEGNDDERAIGLADQAVIDAQGGGQTKDLSAIERGGPALKLFTVFYSFMNTAFNLGVGQTMTAKSKAKLAADYALLYVVPPVLGAMLKASLTPGGDDGDDEDMEALARKLAAEQLSYLMGMMVIVREFSGAAKLLTGAEGVRGYEGPAGLRFIPDMTRFVVQAGQGEFDDAFRKSAINVIGGFTGLPAAQVNRTITGAKALNEGDTDNPAALIFGFQK